MRLADVRRKKLHFFSYLRFGECFALFSAITEKGADMSSVRQNKNLAYEIGLCRIAVVVDQVHREMKKHERLEKFFREPENWGDRRARLTYFWWVVLGGNKLRTVALEVIPQRLRVGVSDELLRDWLHVLGNAALPILGEEQTRAWMQRAEQVARTYLISDESKATQLAMAS